MPPWLFLALVISLLAASGYQIVRVKSLRRVPIYWIVVFGCFLGAEAAADSAHIALFRLGELAIIPDLVGVALALVAMRFARL